MDKEAFDLVQFIEKRRTERKDVLFAWYKILELHNYSPFTEEVFNDIQTKISSRIAQIDRSIQDHKKLLPTTPNPKT